MIEKSKLSRIGICSGIAIIVITAVLFLTCANAATYEYVIKYVMISKSVKYYNNNKFVTKFAYNEKGMVTKETKDNLIVAYEYDSKNRIKRCRHKSQVGIRKATVNYSYDKKGRLKKYKSDGSHGSNTYDAAYFYDSADRVVRINYDWRPGFSKIKYKYDKKDQVVKMISSGEVIKYKYDKQGNLTSRNDGSVTKYKNSYDKNKCLKMTVCDDENGESKTFKYTFKKIKVKKKYTGKIKKQQWALQNDEVQLVFPKYW